MDLPLTPETKVGAVLEAYPGVEDQLIAWVPAFKKLKDLKLRKSVTKLVTVEQAARIAGIPVTEIIDRLRAATSGSGSVGGELITPQGSVQTPPEWLDEARVCCHIDADSLIAEGIHPLGRTLECVTKAGKRDIVKVTSSFHPAPLIDKFRRSGASVYSSETSPGVYSTYICARP